MDIKINTGKELLDSGITKFEVRNGAWIGEVVIRNNKPHLYCTDCAGTLVNSFPFNNKTNLDLIIKPLEYNCNKQDVVHISGQLRDVIGLLVGTPIRYNDKVVGVVESVDVENSTYAGTIDKAHWESLVGEQTLGFSMELRRE
jgi:hypothetical protein